MLISGHVHTRRRRLCCERGIVVVVVWLKKKKLQKVHQRLSPLVPDAMLHVRWWTEKRRLGIVLPIDPDDGYTQ